MKKAVSYLLQNFCSCVLAYISIKGWLKLDYIEKYLLLTVELQLFENTIIHAYIVRFDEKSVGICQPNEVTWAVLNVMYL